MTGSHLAYSAQNTYNGFDLVLCIAPQALLSCQHSKRLHCRLRSQM